MHLLSSIQLILLQTQDTINNRFFHHNQKKTLYKTKLETYSMAENQSESRAIKWRYMTFSSILEKKWIIYKTFQQAINNNPEKIYNEISNKFATNYNKLNRIWSEQNTYLTRMNELINKKKKLENKVQKLETALKNMTEKKKNYWIK